MQKKNQPIPILFENDQCMVFDKPAGLLVIPSPRNERKTLTSLVNQQYAKDYKLHPCHRLDKDTTGVILYAKGKKFQKLLMDEFKKQAVQKRYIAIVQGHLKQRQATLKGSIQSFEDRKFLKRKAGKPAMTKYSVLKRNNRFSIVEVEPVTGRSNQIRIHFKQIGHPLVGERKYAFRRDSNLRFKRCALHAAMLQWQDPVKHKMIKVQSNLPKDMEVFIDANTTTHRN